MSSADIREKIALFADVDTGAVVSSPDVPDVYLVPQPLQAGKGWTRSGWRSSGSTRGGRLRRVERARGADRDAA